MNDPQDPHSSGLAYEFEVKEQDRWLPIANGKSSYSPILCFLPCWVRYDSSALVVAPFEPKIARLHGDRALFGRCRFRSAYQRVLHSHTLMSNHSSPETPEAPRALSSKADKADIYDANIRNFAPVARIMKNALPENAKIAKEAKECMQECVSEFISFITSEGKPAVT